MELLQQMAEAILTIQATHDCRQGCVGAQGS